MKSKAKAIWQGKIKEGEGHLTTTSSALQNVPYTFKSRFEGADGTNPEELLGAAHAGCFSMALSMVLGEAGHTPEKIETHATVTVEPEGDGFAIKTVHLDVTGTVPGASEADFLDAAGKAKGGCPMSKVLNAEITMDAKLAS